MRTFPTRLALHEEHKNVRALTMAITNAMDIANSADADNSTMDSSFTHGVYNHLRDALDAVTFTTYGLTLSESNGVNWGSTGSFDRDYFEYLAEHLVVA